MKTKLPILITVLAIVFSMAGASAQQTVPINPATGLPVSPPNREVINPATGLPEPVSNIDTATGLPADGSPPFKDSSGSPSWIDPAWPDSGKVLPSVNFISLPLSEVTRFLQMNFTNYFDIIFPTGAMQVPAQINPATGLPEPANGFDPTQIDIDLYLQKVTATEIFNAMNLQFELDKSPLRWELTMNGSRPTAILRYLPQLAPAPPAQIRKVFYVGDILDEYSGTNDLQKLQSISEVLQQAWSGTGLPGGAVNTYPPGQLLIVSGTPDQVDLAEQTLHALVEKADYENAHPRLH